MPAYQKPLYRTVGYTEHHPLLPVFCAKNLPNVMPLPFVIPEHQLDKTDVYFYGGE